MKKSRKPPEPRYSENEVEDQIIKFLLARRWIPRRQHSGLYYTKNGTPIRIGEVGMADWSFMRSYAPGLVEYLEVETKKTKGKPEDEQREYIAKRLHQGISATWADSLEKFTRWYDEEGFSRADT